MSESMEVILARVDERTKYMKGRLDEHIENDCTPELMVKVQKLETNVSWIKRIGVGVPTTITALFAAWKGLIE